MSDKKPQTDSPARRKLLDAAQQLMIAKGYTACSVDEICEAAGLTKGSFFHYFEGKEHLGREVARHFYDGMRQASAGAAFHQSKDPLDRIFGRLDFYAAMAGSPQGAKGCLLGTFIQELSQTHAQIRAVCAGCFEEAAVGFSQELEAAKARHAPKAKWNPRSVAEHLTAVMQGAMILAKAKQDPGVIAQSVGHFREYLGSLFGK